MSIPRILCSVLLLSLSICPLLWGQGSRLLISEVQVGGASSDIEFVELYNPTDSPINLSSRGINLRLHIRNGNGSADVNKTLTFIRTTIPPYGYFLLASSAFERANPGMSDATYSASSNALLSDGCVYISRSGAILTSVIDRVGWGTGADALGFEGARFSSTPPPGGSIERKMRNASNTPGYRLEMDNNALDFAVRAASSPQNSMSEVLNLVPALTALAPDTAFRGHSTAVVLTGENFIGGTTSVNFGPGITVDSIGFVGADQLIAFLTVDPAAESGQRDVVVSNGSGASVTASRTFVVVNPAPSIVNVSPQLVTYGQTHILDITGNNLMTGVTTINPGAGITVNSLTVNSSVHATATVTIEHFAVPGPREVIVTNAAPGGGVTTLAEGILVGYPAPTLSGISPSVGVRGETIQVKLGGENFVAGVTSVSFGPEISVNTFSVTSLAEGVATIIIPISAAAGPIDVSATNPAPGGGLSTVVGALTISNPAPVATAIAPTSAMRGSTVTLTMTGARFIDGVTSVSLGDQVSVNAVTVKSSGELAVSITIGATAATGGRSVVIANAAPGGGSVTITNAFTVEAGIPTDVEKTQNVTPETFALHEAYPNPFNPMTTIRYAVPELARVKLEVYNMLGNVVAVLATREQSMGFYEITWFAENQPSGVYLVRMQAEGLESQKRFIGSRKVMLVK
ncbi:MAG: lamin tail domain-containing protein [Ignavibacteriales bacterium]|nr:lamin tail domain-containing protein [Ignavibacteriales bacterium]